MADVNLLSQSQMPALRLPDSPFKDIEDVQRIQGNTINL